MKNSKIWTVMIVAGLAASASASAGVADMAGTWTGSGAQFTLDGQMGGTYQVVLVDELQADGSVKSDVTVTVPSAPTKSFTQIMRDTEHGFAITSEMGSGGAICLGDGVCEGYIGDSSGNGAAMTVIKDGSDRLRLVRVQLENFRATRIYRESYVRTHSHQ